MKLTEQSGLKLSILTIVLASMLIVGCQRQNEVELTLVAQKISLETQIGAIRETATVDAERLQITVEYMGTLVGRAEEQRSQLQATLVARGSDPSSIGADAAAFTTPFPTPDNGVVNNVPGAVETPLVPTVELSPQAAVPGLQNITMAPGVGSDDCALNPTSSFTLDTAEIYVVATGVSITAGTNVAARFAIAGQEIRHDFTPDFDIDGNCIWFFIDQDDLPFVAGTWSVQLELNGASASSPIPFTITESS
jgi:hypothetical protein